MVCQSAFYFNMFYSRLLINIYKCINLSRRAKPILEGWQPYVCGQAPGALCDRLERLKVHKIMSNFTNNFCKWTLVFTKPCGFMVRPTFAAV